MHKLIIPAVAAAVFTLAACGGNTNTNTNSAANADSLKVDSMQTAVIQLHDEGMAHTMAIRRLRARSLEVLDSLKSKKNYDTTAYSGAITLLDSATNAMNTWMHGFDLKQEGKSLAERQSYLEAEQTKMTDVKALMETSIQQAKSLLKEQ